MSGIDISVVIPSHNEEKYLPFCLKSLIKQDFKRKYEIIIANNASSDKTYEIATKFNVKVIQVKRKGVTFAREAGFREAKGAIVVSTDADTVFPKNWLSEIYQRFDENENLIGLSGSTFLWDGNIFDNLLAFPHIGYSYIRYFLKIGFFSGCNMAVKKNAFEKIGGFDLQKISAEDLDLCKRLQKIGKIKFFPEVYVKTSARKLKEYGYLKFAFYNVHNQIRVGILNSAPLAMQDIRKVKKSPNLNLRRSLALLLMLATSTFVYLSHSSMLEARELANVKLHNELTATIINKVKDLDIKKVEQIISMQNTTPINTEK